ncbi:hypothetical protein ACPV5E_18535, partial [Vibrio mediterranei]|uniref:hypothetical protein n=1 Tax=Vibrio mediterranei TaxID=689 RepID=UPI004067C333
CSGENYINRLHRHFLSLPYTRNQHSSERESISFKPEGWITIEGREGLKYCGICHGETGKLIPLQTTENTSTGKINYECGCNKMHRFNGDGTPKRTGAIQIRG